MKSKPLIFVILVALMMALFAVPATAVLDTSTDLTAHEAEFLATLDYDNAEYYAQYLTKDIGNRIAYSPRVGMAADWLMSELESFGYEPYIHEFTYGNPTNNGILWVDGQHYAYHGPTWNASSVYKYDSRGELIIEGVAVLNWPASSSPLTLPADVDYAGKAVFVTLNGTSMPSAANAYNAALTLQNAGAAAVMFQTYPMAANGNTTYARIGNTTSGTAITIPVGTTLNYETAGISGSWGEDTEVSVTMYSNNVGKNVVAVLPSATGSEKNVYITTHHDTTGSGPGMNDNGSGTIMMLEMARAFKDWKFDYNLVFISFDNEEGGLRGAYAYCADMSQEERANFVADYNMDMISSAQENCIHFFLNISDTGLQTLERNLGNNDRLLLYPGAIEIAQKYDVFNHTYLAAQKLDFNMNYFNICYDTTTDHYAFVRYGNGYYDSHVNMMNSVEYDWRTNEKGTSFETLYHKAGDSYEINFSRDRLETVGDIVALAIYYSARGDIELDQAAPTAAVKKLSGNKNDLTIVVTETWTNYEDISFAITFTKTFSISNNAAGTYQVGPYDVYVNTKGNDQIRDCYIIN